MIPFTSRRSGSFTRSHASQNAPYMSVDYSIGFRCMPGTSMWFGVLNALTACLLCLGLSLLCYRSCLWQTPPQSKKREICLRLTSGLGPTYNPLRINRQSGCCLPRSARSALTQGPIGGEVRCKFLYGVFLGKFRSNAC